MRGYDDEMTAIMTQGSLYVARKLCIIIIIILIIKDNVYGAVIMTYSHCDSSPGSSNAGQHQASVDPPTKPTDFGVESAYIGCIMT